MKTKQLICAMAALSLLMPVLADTSTTPPPAAATPCQEVADDESPPSIAYIKCGFDVFDRNSDGRITLDEAKVSPPVVPYFRELDEDADGGISLAEWTAYFRHTPAG